MNIKNTQKDFQGASSPELATSSLTWLVAWLVMKLLRFVAEAKKLSNHHRTPISSSMFGPGRRDLTSLKWPTAHKSLLRRVGVFWHRHTAVIKSLSPHMVSVIGADQREKVILGAQLSYQI